MMPACLPHPILGFKLGAPSTCHSHPQVSNMAPQLPSHPLPTYSKSTTSYTLGCWASDGMECEHPGGNTGS